MKKSLIALLLSLAVVTPLMAQQRHAAPQKRQPKVTMEWGVKAGANYTNFYNKSDDFAFKPQLGAHAAVTMGVVFGAFAIQPELQYSYSALQVKSNSDLYKVKINNHNIEFPLLFSVRIPKPMRFYAGPSFTLLSDSRYQFAGKDYEFGHTKPAVTYVVGVGAYIANAVTFDLRFNGQFNPTHNMIGEHGAQVDMRAYSLLLSIGYIF